MYDLPFYKGFVLGPNTMIIIIIELFTGEEGLTLLGETKESFPELVTFDLQEEVEVYPAEERVGRNSS